MKFIQINPGGNITAIVRGQYSQKNKLLIAAKILTQNKKIEQVGFWEKSRKSAAKLKMAGGEFCGNATRALAYAVSKEIKSNQFYLESSGIKRPHSLYHR